MNYKFHVGDYVGFTDGNGKHTGYVISYYNYPIRNVYSFTFEFDDGTHFGWSGNIDDLPHNITRIGAYDFTKKEKKKIDNLTKPQWSMQVEDLIDKINELVDAVNKLRNDYDEHIEAHRQTER